MNSHAFFIKLFNLRKKKKLKYKHIENLKCKKLCINSIQKL